MKGRKLEQKKKKKHNKGEKKGGGYKTQGGGTKFSVGLSFSLKKKEGYKRGLAN